MRYIFHPNVTNERHLTVSGRSILVADTTVILDCCDPRFSRFARDQVELHQYLVANRHGFDEVRLNQI